jgi:SAM-dependent methyltransferase
MAGDPLMTTTLLPKASRNLPDRLAPTLAPNQPALNPSAAETGRLGSLPHQVPASISATISPHPCLPLKGGGFRRAARFLLLASTILVGLSLSAQEPAVGSNGSQAGPVRSTGDEPAGEVAQKDGKSEGSPKDGKADGSPKDGKAGSTKESDRAKKPERPKYEFRREHDPNGTGKFYMGREIAQVMGHQGADWLERPEREEEEEPTRMVDALKLKEGDVVADIGCGTGFIAWKLAKKVGPTGKVYGVDIQPEMLARLRLGMKRRGVNNVEPVMGAIQDPKLPANSVDLIIMVDVYHEFSHPWEMTDAMVKALKPGGRLVFIEYRREDESVPIKLVHKMSVDQVKKEMTVHPLDHDETIGILPWQHIIIFKKRNEPAAPASAPKPAAVPAPATAPAAPPPPAGSNGGINSSGSVRAEGP